MKRCPQCEFIYEDDQSLCDMDGVLLVYDSRILPNLHALTTVPVQPKPQPKRNRAVPAFATVILALVLGMVYYVSIHRKAVQNTYMPPPAANTASTSDPAPAVVPTPEVQPQPVAEEPKPTTVKPAAAVAPAPAPPRKSAAKTPVAVKPEPKKDDSKVGSILKKTGNLLKKPFKL